MVHARTIPGQLRWQWYFVVSAWLLGVVGLGSAWYWWMDEPGLAGTWALGAILVGGFVVATVRLHLRRNHPPNRPERTFSTLGPATLITLIRGGCLTVLAGMVLVSPAGVHWWLPAGLYAGVAGLDWIDGRVARRTNRVTVLGERLDMALDTAGLLIATIVAIRWYHLPVWYLCMPAARYVYRAGIGLRERRGKPVFPLSDSRIRRPMAGLQMAFVAIALLPILPKRAIVIGAAIVMIPGLLVFVRDYLAVTGRIG